MYIIRRIARNWLVPHSYRATTKFVHRIGYSTPIIARDIVYCTKHMCAQRFDVAWQTVSSGLHWAEWEKWEKESVWWRGNSLRRNIASGENGDGCGISLKKRNQRYYSHWVKWIWVEIKILFSFCVEGEKQEMKKLGKIKIIWMNTEIWDYLEYLFKFVIVFVFFEKKSSLKLSKHLEKNVKQ